MRRPTAILVVLLIQPSALLRALDEKETARLARTTHLWTAIKYFHPDLATATIDWDAALLQAIPEIRAARDRSDYRAAVQTLLEVLDDPLTRVHDDRHVPVPPAPDPDTGISSYVTDDQILVVIARNYFSLDDAPSRRALMEAQNELASVRAVLFDLRASEAPGDYGHLMLENVLRPVLEAIVEEEVARPGRLRRVYYGYDAPSSFASGQYLSGLFTRGASPLRPGPEARKRPSVLLVNELSTIPDAMLALHLQSELAIVFEGPAGHAGFGESTAMDLGEGLSAIIRTAESVDSGGRSARVRPDEIVPHSVESDAAFEAALAALRPFQPRSTSPREVPVVPSVTSEKAYRGSDYPTEQLRILAAVRFWGVIEHFYPYKELLEDDWTEVLPELIEDFARAPDALGYALAVAGAAKRLHDGHAYVAGGQYRDGLVGPGFPPVRVRRIEEELVLAAIYDADMARDAGLSVGDVVVEVDGEEAAARLERYETFFSASTPQGLADKATLSFLNGPIGSPVSLVVRRGDGSLHAASLTRRHEDHFTLYHRERTTDVLRWLPGNIGYVDLDRLEYAQVDEIFERFGDADGIVFDMRGYPKATIWAIAPRLTDSRPIVARFITPTPGHASPEIGGLTFSQRIGVSPPGVRIYRGPTAMLMDERSQSQAEHTGLFLKAANDTVFVGSATAGANGEITSVILPGGYTVGFTGQAVTWPGGRQLQRVGLTPDIPVLPTIEGVREGRDEVLEAARRYLDELR